MFSVRRSETLYIIQTECQHTENNFSKPKLKPTGVFEGVGPVSSTMWGNVKLSEQ